MALLRKFLVLLVRNKAMKVPDDDLKHVLLLIKFAQEKLSYRSDR